MAPITSIPDDINYGFDFVRQDETRYFVFATGTAIYQLDRLSKVITQLASGLGGNIDKRWQSDVMNDTLFLTNGVDTIRQYDGTTLSVLTGDGSLPTAARYIINSVNHLVLAFTTEGGVFKPFRVRWSDVGDQTTWISSSTNEAGFQDVTDIGELRGVAALGTFSFIVYGEDGIYRFDYVGLPFIYAKYRVVTDIGLVAPYSLVAHNDSHFFLGDDGFYEYSGSGAPVRIGLDSRGTSRVDTFIFNDFNLVNPNRMFGFAHPTYPEVWWVYQSKNASFFNRAIVYNWQDRVWAMRDPLPMSMFSTILLQSGFQWNQANFAWNSPQAQVPWYSLLDVENETVISGD